VGAAVDVGLRRKLGEDAVGHKHRVLGALWRVAQEHDVEQAGFEV